MQYWSRGLMRAQVDNRLSRPSGSAPFTAAEEAVGLLSARACCWLAPELLLTMALRSSVAELSLVSQSHSDKTVPSNHS